MSQSSPPSAPTPETSPPPAHEWVYALVDLVAGGVDLRGEPPGLYRWPWAGKMATGPDPAQDGDAREADTWPDAIADWMVGGLPVPDLPPQGMQSGSPSVLQVAVGVSGLAILGSVVGGTWGARLVAQRLLPKVEATLANTLNRPVVLGALEQVSLGGVQIGKTHIPPTDTGDFSATIEAIQVNLDWRALFFQGILRPSITLVRPTVSLMLGAGGEAGGLPSLGSHGSSSQRLQLQAIRVRQGSLTVGRWWPEGQAIAGRSPLKAEHLTLDVGFQDNAQQVSFDLRGQVAAGRFHLEGQADLENRALQADVRTQALPLSGINLMLPPTVGVQAGTLTSDMSATLGLTETGELAQDNLNLQGTASLESGEVWLSQFAAPLSQVQSTLQFQGQGMTLADSGFQLGDVTLTAAGSVDWQRGYNLQAQIFPLFLKADQAGGAPAESAEAITPVQLTAHITGTLKHPQVQVQTQEGSGETAMPELETVATAIALREPLLALPPRQRIDLIEGASYEFRDTGAWFTLSNGTVVPPLSEGAFQQGVQRFNTALVPGLDRKYFWLLQTNPYVTAIAADLAKGQLQSYLEGAFFNTDRFFLEHFLPVYMEFSRAAGLDPGESLWMLDHSLLTLRDPLLRAPDATPITSGAGTVGSFWEDEQALSMKQMVVRPYLAQEGQFGNWTRLGVLKKLEESTSLESRRLSSTPEVMSKLPNVTFGAEEGAIAHALGILQFQGVGIYSDALRTLAATIVQNERDKQAVRAAATATMTRLATEHTQEIGDVLALLTPEEWQAIGLGPHLSATEAAYLNGGNTLSVLVSRHEKAGYPLELAYQNSRALLLELVQTRPQIAGFDRVVFALLKDHAFQESFWELLAQKLPPLAPEFATIRADMATYRRYAAQGATLHEAFYGAMVEEDQDIGVNAAIKHAIGFQAHLASLIDQAFAPANPQDPRYQAFRRSLAIYLREAPDISVYGGTEAAIRLYGQETLNVQELIAVDVAAAPRIRAFARLYREAVTSGTIGEWDMAGFQRILLLGAMLAAGVERHELPADIASVGFPSAQFRRDLLFVVGPEGINIEATRLGVQAHDYRVSFQPLAVPPYRSPSFEVTDAAACPTQPRIQAIALGPLSEFSWDPATQRVLLKRARVACPLPDTWTSLTFDTLLETVPIAHSEAGAQHLQAKLREAQLLEAGIF